VLYSMLLCEERRTDSSHLLVHTLMHLLTGRDPYITDVCIGLLDIYVGLRRRSWHCREMSTFVLRFLPANGTGRAGINYKKDTHLGPPGAFAR